MSEVVIPPPHNSDTPHTLVEINTTTFFMLLNNYPREEVETRHVPPCYDKKHISSLTSTQLVFFDKVHVKQVSGPPTKIQVNDYKVLFPRVTVLLGVDKVEIKEYGTITRKSCPVFNYTGKKIVTIYAYKKEIQN